MSIIPWVLFQRFLLNPPPNFALCGRFHIFIRDAKSGKLVSDSREVSWVWKSISSSELGFVVNAVPAKRGEKKRVVRK